MPFKLRRRVTVRLFRPALQWTMYGANERRTQAPPDIKVRPPFKVVWSRGLGSLVEFPAVVADGVAYVGNYKGQIYALNMRNGAVLWRYRPSRGKMASSPAIVGDDLVVHGMDGIVRVLDRSSGRLRWHFRVGSPIESSPIVSGGARLLRRLERPCLRPRPEAAKAALELPHGLQDHVERGDRRADALHRRLRRPPACPRHAHRQAPLRPLCQRPRLRDAGGGGGPRLRPLVDRQQPDGILDVAAATSGASARAATSTPRPRSGRDGSSSAPTAGASTRSRRRAAASSGACPRAARSQALRSSSPASPTPARRGAASPASTRGTAASCSDSRTASTCPSPATAAGCSCTATRACGRSSHAVERDCR